MMQKLSYTTMASPDWDGVTAIRKAREYGFHGVDLRISDHLGELTLASTDEEISALKRVFNEEGILSPSLLAYNVHVSADPQSFVKFGDSVRRNLELGAKLGTQRVRIFPGDPAVSKDPKGFIQGVADQLAGVLARDASPTGLVIQNHVGGVGIADILEIIKRVNHPRLGLVLCPANAAQMNEDVFGFLPGLRDGLPQIYIADLLAEKSPDNGHNKTALPGKGFLDYPRIYAGLGGDRFQGWTTFKWEKIWARDLPDPDIALPHFIRYMKGLAG